MIRRIAIAIAVAFAFALGGCATYDSGYRQASADGSYRGNYDGGYYAAPADGYGDFYYDRPETIVNTYGGYQGYGYLYSSFGFGYGSPGPFGFGFNPGFAYDPWYGYGYPYAWYHPWPRHHHPRDHDNDHPPGAQAGGRGYQQQRMAAPLGNRQAVDVVPQQPVPMRERSFGGAPREPRPESRSERPSRRDAQKR